LAFMRGRTLSHSFVILDEAQNCTSEQMKMLLTRIGFDTRTVITDFYNNISTLAINNDGDMSCFIFASL